MLLFKLLRFGASILLPLFLAPRALAGSTSANLTSVVSVVNSTVVPGAYITFKQGSNPFYLLYRQVYPVVCMLTFHYSLRPKSAKQHQGSSRTRAMSISHQMPSQDRTMKPTHSSGSSNLESNSRQPHSPSGSKADLVLRRQLVQLARMAPAPSTATPHQQS